MLMYLATMEKTAVRMGNIVESLLLLASIRQQQEVPVNILDLAAIVAEVQDRMKSSIAESGATVKIAPLFPAAVGYAPWVEEVLLNYMSNALKYGGQPPLVSVGADAAEDGQVRIWVRDNGQGLTAEQQAQLFVPFTRITQAKIKGHGLGLSIVRQIVERLGGTVAVSSQVGHGSEFSFSLPAAEAIS
jgi:signal transduction histidine kinase